MKILKEIKFTKKNKSYHSIVFQLPPRKRFIYLFNNRQSVQYPYIYGILAAREVKNNGNTTYVYEGQPGKALSVFCSDKELNDFLKDNIGIMPTEGNMDGVVCTNHRYDNKKFKTFEELSNFVLAEWLYSNNAWYSMVFKNYAVACKAAQNILLEDYNPSNFKLHNSIERAYVKFHNHYLNKKENDNKFLEEHLPIVKKYIQKLFEDSKIDSKLYKYRLIKVIESYQEVHKLNNKITFDYFIKNNPHVLNKIFKIKSLEVK